MARGFRIGHSVTPPAQFALEYVSNGEAGGDVRTIWDGDVMLDRMVHAIIWDAFYIQHTGYYAWKWFAHNDGSFHFDKYESGNHPFPCDGEFETSGNIGNASGGTGSGGEVHYHESAGHGGADYIRDETGNSNIVVKGQWLKQGCASRLITVSSTDDTIEELFYFDFTQPSKVIRTLTPVAGFPTPSAPAFYFGASDWTASGSANSECPSGRFRNWQLYSAYKSAAQLLTLSSLLSNAAIVAHADAGGLHYVNIDPTPTDIADKSGLDNHPRWANANRPTAHAL